MTKGTTAGRTRDDLKSNLIHVLRERDPARHAATLELLEKGTEPAVDLLAQVEDPEIDEVLWFVFEDRPADTFVPLLAQTIVALARRRHDPKLDQLVADFDGEKLDDTLAVELLGELGDRRAVPFLREYASDDQEGLEPGGVRMTACRAMALCGKASTIPFLLGLMDEMDMPDDRAAMHEAIALIGEEAVMPLLRKLEKGDPETGTNAAAVLSLIGDPRALPALGAAIEPEARKAEQRVEVVLRFGTPGLVEVLKAVYPIERFRDLMEMLTTRFENEKELLFSLVAGGEREGEGAACLLAQMEDEATENRLVEVVRDPRTPSGIRGSIADNLRAFPRWKALATLLALVEDKTYDLDDGDPLARSLHQHASERTVPELTVLGQSSDPEIAARAKLVLKALG